MAKVKNTGKQPRGFWDDQGNQVVVAPGDEREFNMTEADYKHLTELIKDEDPPPYELSGSAGGVKKLTPKEQRDADARKAEEAAKKAADEARAADMARAAPEEHHDKRKK